MQSFSLAMASCCNLDDMIVLQIGSTGIGTRMKWEVGRECRGMEGLWADLVGLVGSRVADSDGDEGEERCEYEIDLDAAGMLGEMVGALLEQLPKSMEAGETRPEVQRMWVEYAVSSGVDGIGIREVQILRYMDGASGMHGPYMSLPCAHADPFPLGLTANRYFQTEDCWS
jgi:hypothetical protein